FAESRINPKREFFRLDPEKVVLAISMGEFKEVTPGGAEVEPEEQQALEKSRLGAPKSGWTQSGSSRATFFRFRVMSRSKLRSRSTASCSTTARPSVRRLRH